MTQLVDGLVVRVGGTHGRVTGEGIDADRD